MSSSGLKKSPAGRKLSFSRLSFWRFVSAKSKKPLSEHAVRTKCFAFPDVGASLSEEVLLGNILFKTMAMHEIDVPIW